MIAYAKPAAQMLPLFDDETAPDSMDERIPFPMKHDILNSAKYIRTRRELRKMMAIPANYIVGEDSIVIGLLERISHLAITSAQAGDIGRIDNATIAESLGWQGNENDLIDALVRGGWLIECKTHRLILADWEHFAPMFIRGNLASHGKQFARPEFAPEEAPEEVAKQPAKQPAKEGAKRGAINITKHNLTKPNLTKPNRKKGLAIPETGSRAPSVSPDDVFDYWNSKEDTKTARKLSKPRRAKLVTRLADPDWPWREAIDKLPIPNREGFDWQPDFDWLIRNEENALSLVEGKYEGSGLTGCKASPGVTYDPSKAHEFGEGL